MKRQEVLAKMFASKMVRITKSFRSYWGDGRIPLHPIGEWFHIQSYHDDDTVQLCSNSTHQMFRNVPIKELKP